jgi:hypothetical protein
MQTRLGEGITPMKSLPRKNPLRHVRKIRARLSQLIVHLRGDVGKVAEPKAQALFETAAEVLGGLSKAFADYEKKIERAWK